MVRKLGVECLKQGRIDLSPATERLSLEVIFWTGAHISDAIRLWHRNIDKED